MPSLRAAALLVALVGVPFCCSAEVPVPAEDAACRVRSVPVSAFTRDGISEPRFGSANFIASYNEMAVRVTSVAVEQQPHKIVLLLDISGSMLGATDPSWKVPLDVARDLVNHMPPTVEMGLAVFSGRMVPIVAPTQNHQSLLDQLETLRANQKLVEAKSSSGTALWDSVLEATALLQPSQPGDVIYVVTDGADNLSRVDHASVSQTLAASGIRLFCFGIVNGEWLRLLRTTELVTGATEMMRVMEATGGWGMAATPAQWDSFQKSRKPAQFERDMNLQFRQLSNFYRVNLELPEPLTGPQEWRLFVTGLDESRQSNLQLIYPRRLMPCGALGGATAAAAATVPAPR